MAFTMRDLINKKEDIDYFVSTHKIFIDTCSILWESAGIFWDSILPYLKKYNNKVIVPYRVFEELQKHANNSKDTMLSEKSRQGIKELEKFIKEDLVELRGEKTDNFADNVFQVVFTKFRLTHRLLLITQDNDLARDILALNHIKSVKANQVYVKRIDKYGELSDFYWNLPGESTNGSNGFDMVFDNAVDNSGKFKLCEEVTRISDDVIKVKDIPGERDDVFFEGKRIKLLGKIAEGGEGVLYKTNTEFIAKIYLPRSITQRKFEKIKLMMKKRIAYEGICYPVGMLYNAANEFVGILLPRAEGKELQKSLFIKPLLLKNFPNWKKRDTVELCLNILRKISFLNEHNIILGDINPSNILVKSPKEVYFVDTDSYQIEDFPCPVGTINYTAPEIQKKHFSSFLRSRGNEHFAIATLLFMIMLPGKPPYSQQGGENPVQNIINMDFSYPFEDSSNKKTPDGPWRYIWSHLTYELKKAFYHTFQAGGDYSTENTRLSATEWIPIFETYLELLDSGAFGEQDQMSEELFPTRHKKHSSLNYQKCKLCHQEFPDNQMQKQICVKCLNEGVSIKCAKCKKAFVYTNYLKYIKEKPVPKCCYDCYKKGKEAKCHQKCKSCGRSFVLTGDEFDWYKDRGFAIPTRCSKCRETKRSASKQQNRKVESKIQKPTKKFETLMRLFNDQYK
ncbi:zinc-ribbon domain containing protein [Abiotrophia defectiva]|uniref:protein kinase domain-containing protein n=1 Tax=Abiotrophia defectiva TaxID=46125 RepID=UPI0022827FC8|nr:zinc-ribbon domain containing protein [Abiotrophia defectiva]MCY7225710.1 zinc-ribbon domain containing protein [Abiotrophia defectiva]